ncbi:MAG: adenylosuccinate synthase, partial [Bacteroidetes bacterium SW_11_45_7]
MFVDVLLGLQWGDEGKGKIVDHLAPHHDIIARFQGGPNAGHTIVFNKNQHILHTIPSGIFREDKINIIGNGVVVDPTVIKDEIEAIKAEGVDVTKNLYISKRAHLILPTHKALDAASEARKGKSKIGSTLRGIGPAYMDKTGRNGLMIGDILSPGFSKQYETLKKKPKDMLRHQNFEYDTREIEHKWFEGIELLRSLNLINSEMFINDKLAEGKTVLAEGAQGSMLDIDFGTYPYVTSSNTISSGACKGLGIPPKKVREVIGVSKAYC